MAALVDNIRVAVIYGPHGKIRPVWFDLERRQHRIEQITNSWQERRGRKTLTFFHVSDGGCLYELVCDMETGCWQLERIEAF